MNTTNTTSLAAAMAYLLTYATNAQKQAFFETLESENGKGFGDNLPYTYQGWIADDGVEWLRCDMPGIASFIFHY